MKFIAGELCLDFANTLDWHASDHPRETLESYEDWVAWSLEAEVVNRRTAGKLRSLARRHPRKAGEALNHATAVREAIYRLALGKPAASDLERFNSELRIALAQRSVTAEGGGFAWTWTGIDRSLDGLLWPVVHSAAELFCSDRRSRIGRCADDRGCGWLFLDTSRNRSRRWCDMKDCGNRAKAQRHYRRARRS